MNFNLGFGAMESFQENWRYANMGGAQGYLKGRGEAACPRESNVAEGRWARLC